MASRDDVDVFWHLSPRLILVRQPSDNINIQDLHDTLRDKEQEQNNLIYPKLLSTAGGEDLGGGITVGLTSTLENARVGFETRNEWTASGICTSTTTDAGTTLVDSAATFETTFSGLSPGFWIVNLDDGSLSTVINIDSQTQLTTTGLGGGDVNQWTTSDRYKILEVTQVEVDGGNLVSVDNDKVPLDAIFPTAGTQPIRTSASSATRVSQTQLEHSVFNGAVTVDVINGTSGTRYPIGTEHTPVNNVPQAVEIAATRGFSRIDIIGDITLDTGDDLSGYIVYGQNPSRTTITVNAGASVADIEVHDATITGTFDVAASFTGCHIVNLSFVEGNLHDCILEGTIVLAGSGQTSLYNCSDGLTADTPPPSIDFNGSGRSLAIRNYHGDIQLENKTGPEEVEINMNSGGHVLIAASVSDGLIRLTGILEITNLSSVELDISQVVFPDQLQLAAFNGHIHIDVSNGTAGTEFPQGTHQHPVDNLADALTIAGVRSLERLLVSNTLVVGASENIDGLELEGSNPLTSVVVLQAGCSTDRTEFRNMILTGELNGPAFCRDVGLQTLTGIGSDTFPTLFDRCVFRAGTQTLASGLSTPMNVHFIDCASGVPGSSYPTLDFNATAIPVAFRNYAGGLEITNYTGGQESTFGFNQGQFVIDSTCTSGIAQLDGIVERIDNSGPGFVVDPRSHIHASIIENAVWEADIADHQDTATFGGWIARKVLTVAKFLGLK
jgi:hypothetical protein